MITSIIEGDKLIIDRNIVLRNRSGDVVRVYLCGAFTRGHLRVENGELDHHSENKSAL